MNAWLWGAAVLAGAWTVLAALLYAGQDSMLFFRRPPDPAAEAHLLRLAPGAVPLRVPTADGQVLAGWLVHRQGAAGQAPALVYFGGNAEEATGFLLDSLELPVTLAAVNYRGYGASTGTPGEAALKADALAVHDAVASLTNGRVAVMGRSLGAGLAAHVAANRDVAAVVLVTPYDSIRAVAQGHYPFVPVGILLRHPFDALPDAARAKAPALFLVAAHDDIIPPERARALHEAWAGDRRCVVVAGAGHNDLHQFPEYRRELTGFLEKTTGGTAPFH